MSEFSAEWLALREPADHAARSARLAHDIRARLPVGEDVRVVDLAAGTGSNMRYLASRLGGRQQWRLVDHDARLLARAAAERPPGVTRVTHECRDLRVLGAPATGGLFDNATLVTASALLDLVSARWVDALADQCRAANAAVLFALSYDGHIECTPADADDTEVRELVNHHQRGDKGFGPALGPDATAWAARSFSERGYMVERDASDWVLGPQDAALQHQLIRGWASAAVDVAPLRAAAIEAWCTRRLGHVHAGRSTVVVGHEDIAGWIAPRDRPTS